MQISEDTVFVRRRDRRRNNERTGVHDGRRLWRNCHSVGGGRGHRDVDARRQPRRMAFGKRPLPKGSELELRSGPIAEELRALAREGVQSLLLEGGPALATALVEAELVDKLLVFVTPHLAGAGLGLLGELTHPLELSRLSAEPVDQDVLISAYVHEP